MTFVFLIELWIGGRKNTVKITLSPTLELSPSQIEKLKLVSQTSLSSSSIISQEGGHAFNHFSLHVFFLYKKHPYENHEKIKLAWLTEHE